MNSEVDGLNDVLEKSVSKGIQVNFSGATLPPPQQLFGDEISNSRNHNYNRTFLYGNRPPNPGTW
jgi:hypothetical protein